MGSIADLSTRKLHRAGENYLEAVLVIHNQKGAVRSVDLAQFLNISKPSVCNGVAVLQKAGYLIMDKDHFLHLTPVGQEIAERIYERHCFFRDFFVYIGVEPEVAEEDACRMEHAISDTSFAKLKEIREKLGF